MKAIVRHELVQLLLVALFMVLPCLGAPSAEDDRHEQAKTLVARASEISNLRSPNTKPFQLRARIRLSDRSGKVVKVAEGTYQLIWAGPRQWREEVTLPGYRRVRVGGEGKFWQQRNTDYEPLLTYEFTRAWDLQARLRLFPGDTLGKIRQRNRKGAKMQCAAVTWTGSVSHTLCFDPLTNAPLRIEYSHRMAYEYGDYTQFENKLVPRTLRIFDKENPVFEMWVEKLVAETAPDPSLFAPPGGAEEWVWCEDPEPPQGPENLRPEEQLLISQAVERRIAVYVVIAADGTLRNQTLVRTDRSPVGPALLEATTRWHFRPQRCNGVPVRSEIIIR